MLKDVILQLYPERYRPTLARLIVTQNCLLRCQMCSFWHKQKPDPSLRELKQWIRELVDFGVEDISIGGGEPFIRKDLIEIVEEIKSYGLTCGITTNGWLLDKVPFPPVDRVEISIDGAKPETHDKIRGVKGSWEKAVDGVKKLKEQGILKQINFVLQADNYLELVDYCNHAKSLGIDVSIIPISLQLAAQPELPDDLAEFDVNLLNAQIDAAIEVGNVVTTREFLDMFLAKLNNDVSCTRCIAPYVEILIFATGDVYPCGNFHKPVGNIKDDKLDNIYNSYEELRREVRRGSYSPCGKCVYPDIIFARGLWQNTKKLITRRMP